MFVLFEKADELTGEIVPDGVDVTFEVAGVNKPSIRLVHVEQW